MEMNKFVAKSIVPILCLVWCLLFGLFAGLVISDILSGDSTAASDVTVAATVDKDTFSDDTTTTMSDGVVTATFDKNAGTLTFSGNGAVDDWWTRFDHDDRPFVRTVIFEPGITSIGSCEFDGDLGKYVNLEKVIFEGDINQIDSCAFSDNPNLTTVEFRGSCKKIADFAFTDCVSLGSVDIPDGCQVDPSAFGSSTTTPSNNLSSSDKPNSTQYMPEPLSNPIKEDPTW